MSVIAINPSVAAHAALTNAHSATSANTASRIVTRDGSGNFSAGIITAALSGNATSITGSITQNQVTNLSADYAAISHTHTASQVTDFSTAADARIAANAPNVTIGTANGLSVAGQALSLALATTSVAGAFSASDKTKLDGVATGANVGLLPANNLSDVANAATARTNLVLGTGNDVEFANLYVPGETTFHDFFSDGVGSMANLKVTSFYLGNEEPVGQQTGGAATAGVLYTATEQAMIQKAYDALRTFGFLD